LGFAAKNEVHTAGIMEKDAEQLFNIFFHVPKHKPSGGESGRNYSFIENFL
jgi:hypothetical protein